MAHVCDKIINETCVKMPLVTYANTYMSQQKSGYAMPLSSSLSGCEKKKEEKTLSLDKTIHDFRSSLNIIMGYSELMLDGVLGNMTKEQRDGLRDILTNTQQMLDLVEDIALWKSEISGLR